MNKTFYKFLIIFLLPIGNLYGQSNAIVDYADLIKKDSLKEYISVLASPEFEGRGAESEGLKLAGNYIAGKFQQFGIQSFDSISRFKQELKYIKYGGLSEKSFIMIDSSRLFIENNFVHNVFDHSLENNYTRDTVTKQLIFLGDIQNSTKEDLDTIEFTNKMVVLFDLPTDMRRYFYNRGAHGFFILSESKSEYREVLDRTYKMEGFLEKINVLISGRDKPSFLTIFLSPESSASLFGINKKVFQKIIEDNDNVHKIFTEKLIDSLSFYIHREVEDISFQNIVGYIPASSPTHEHIILTAHYDHLGISGSDIYYGANDNASGVAAVMEMARVMSVAYTEGVQPARNILFAAFTLEESGLIGSEYYVNHPYFELASCRANINVDMIGRYDRYLQKKGKTVYSLVPDTLMADLQETTDSLNNHYSVLQLDDMSGQQDFKNQILRLSDQRNFLNQGVPAVMFFNGLHEDYHQVTDTEDKIDYDAMEKITRLITLLSWELANEY